MIGAGKGEPNALCLEDLASAANRLQLADFKRPKTLSKVAIGTDFLSNSGNCPQKEALS